MNSASQIGGVAGNALSFDGIDDYLAVPNSASIDFGDEDFTISFWIKGQDPDVSSGKRLFEKGSSSVIRTSDLRSMMTSRKRKRIFLKVIF
jgi:hypothetical protein